MVGGGQRLTAKATQPLSVIVWWRPDSDGGLLVLELQPRTGSIIFARDGSSLSLNTEHRQNVNTYISVRSTSILLSYPIPKALLTEIFAQFKARAGMLA